MIEHQPKNPQARIRRLQAAGRIREEDATALSEAFPERAAKPQPPEGARLPPQSYRFLTGEMSEDEFRASGRRAGFQMGLHFGIGLGMVFGVGFGWGSPIWVMALITAVSAPIFGSLFGLVMFRLMIRPAVEQHITFRREAGPVAPIECADAGQCPSCRSEEFEVWRWHKPAMLHWILNPSLAINELVLGQRIPAGIKICVECKAQAVDCQHCHRAIDGMIWSHRNAFGNWSGLHCPHCDGRLPMLSNALAAVVRAPLQLLAGVARLGGVTR